MDVVTSDLLEREAVLSRVHERVARASSGEGGLLVIEGPAGIGKTSLMTAAQAIAAENGMMILSAVGDRLEEDFAFGVVRQMLEPALLSLDPDNRASLLNGAAALAAEPIGMGTSPLGDVPIVLILPPSDPMFPALHGLYWLCANLCADQPLLISVDDAHWADAASLRFLCYLARRIDELAILCIVAAVHDEPATEPLLVEMMSGPFAETVPLGPLSKYAVSLLLRDGLGGEVDETFCVACHWATGGNPFLLRELVSSLKTSGLPPTGANASLVSEIGLDTVSRRLLRRIRHLGPAATQLARAIAVLGPDARLDRAAAVAGLDLEEAGAVTDLLVTHQVLTTADSLRFFHPIVQTSIYPTLLPAERARKHAIAARMLRQDGVSPERVAAHLLPAEPHGQYWVVEALSEAARQALARGNPEYAASYLRRALDEPPPPEERGTIISDLGWAEARSGAPGALDHLREGLKLAPESQTASARASQLAQVLLLAGHVGEAVEVLERGISLLSSDAPERLALEAQLISTAVAEPPTLRRVVERIAPLRDRVEGDSSAERVLLAALAMIAMMRGKPADVAANLAERALGGDRLIREQSADALAVYQAAFVLGIADRAEPAKTAMDAALNDAQTRGSLLGFALASVIRSFLHYSLGALADAEADASNALRALPWDQWLTQPVAVALYVAVLVEKGDLATAGALLQDHNFADRLPETAVFQFVLHSRGMLRLAQGDGPGAIADFVELERRRNDGHLTLLGVIETSLARLRIGEQEQARADANRSLALARSWGTRSAIGIALRVAGLVEGGETGLELLREATATLESSPAQLEYARALVDFGAQLRRRGLRADARQPLKQGLHLANFCGAWALAERALAELRAAGGRPRQATITGVEALTANEHRVADIAAQGLSNRQIAQALFVTTRTIESHLTNAYRKLGITSRDELATALHPAPPVADTRDK